LVLLGIYMAAVGLNALRPAGATKSQPASACAWPVGTAIGLVELIFGTAGPLVVAWLSRRLDNAQHIRASIPMIITVAASTVLVGMAWEGQLSHAVIWERFAILIGLALAGVGLGHRLASRLPVAHLRQIICALLVLSGGLLALNALR
jgi:hypothetical protein